MDEFNIIPFIIGCWIGGGLVFSLSRDKYIGRDLFTITLVLVAVGVLYEGAVIGWAAG